ncbi:LiaF transmembrane domain-containing protein [Guptibacillus hwajinpoensis]|uniref:LiaF transmembrane domain-containing protein n=1 Tax=Guptibacillus hwajinpoensis TaxID=208199 RepID=A0A0J6D4D5_9BACL|nr:hypothetical protein [Alkalihalobacillus macyae]KMM39154.1 hypothetical protein AB986_07975 [Alkalihalobacillus macyae]
MGSWRVGTISMGVCLLFLGVMLLLSQIFDWDTAYVLISWWPLLLIVLGVETLLYFLQSQSEKPYLKFDFLSIFFVGIIGTVGIGFTIFQASGFLDHVGSYLEGEVKTENLPAYNQAVGDEIKRILVDAGNQPVTIESSSEKEVSVFGTYRAQEIDGESLLTNFEEYLFTKEKGDTLYVTFKDLPERQGLTRQSMMQARLVVPSTTELEVTSAYGGVTLNPRALVSSWNVSNASDVSINLSKEENLTVNLEEVEYIHGEASEWQYTDNASGESPVNSSNGDEVVGLEPNQSATLSIGDGDYFVSISKASSVNASIRE